MIKRILITGGTGFIGAYIIKELIEKGYTVRGIRRGTQLPFYIDPLVLAKVEWVKGDILDVVSLQEAMEDVDVVIHAAAVVSFRKKDRQHMYQVNVQGTANVVNMALDQGIKKMVYISSVAAIGRTANGEMVTEEKKWKENKTNTHYAISKYRAEMEVWRGMAEGLPAVILNPSTVLGYGNWHNSSIAIFKNAYRSFPWYTDGINGFVDVRDVAKATVLLMESNRLEERFIISSENWSFKKLFDHIAKGFGKKPPHRKATRQLGAIAWRVEKLKSLITGKKPLLTRETARVSQSKTHFDHSKLTNAFPGFTFIPLTQSITYACEKYEQAIKIGDLKF